MRELHEQTCHQVEELRKEADEHEKLWLEKKEHEVAAWRDKIHKEQEHWEHHIHHQMEASHTQHQREMDDLLHNSYLPNCAKTTGAAPKWVGSGSAADTVATTTTSNLRRQSQVHRRSRDNLRERKKSVRFQQNASVHIIEEDELGFESEPPTEGTTAGGGASGCDDGGNGERSAESAEVKGGESSVEKEDENDSAQLASDDGEQERETGEKREMGEEREIGNERAMIEKGEEGQVEATEEKSLTE